MIRITSPFWVSRRVVAGLFAAVTLTVLAAGHAAAQRQLVMYCGVDEKWCRAVSNAYQKETGVQVDMTRMSAGEVYARVRAEKDNPHGDVWFGGTGDPHLQAADEGVTEPYQSPMLPKLRDWAQRNRFGNVTTPQFIALAERESGQDLDRFFDVWLYQPGKPLSW